MNLPVLPYYRLCGLPPNANEKIIAAFIGQYTDAVIANYVLAQSTDPSQSWCWIQFKSINESDAAFAALLAGGVKIAKMDGNEGEPC